MIYTQFTNTHLCLKNNIEKNVVVKKIYIGSTPKISPLLSRIDNKQTIYKIKLHILCNDYVNCKINVVYVYNNVTKSMLEITIYTKKTRYGALYRYILR